MPEKVKAPQVCFDVVCPDCGCDAIIPLMKLRTERSFTGNRILVEWPSREGVDDFANIACPQCGLVMVLKSGGNIVKSGNHLGGTKPSKKKGK
jgi:predicted RNA-binding Zn-ribbon protein involved in translation (DUF1610 family)